MFDGPAPLVGRREGAWALAVAVAFAGGLVWTARVPEAGSAWRFAFVAVHLAAFGALVVWLRHRRPGTGLVLLGAVVLRLVALPMDPVLSDDGYRYLWDGQLVVEGISPYAYRPSDPRLVGVATQELLETMNSPHYYSVYPPASQAVFALAASAGTPRAQWIWLKVLLVGAELLGVLLMLRVCGTRGATLYAWSPLAMIEVAGQGHSEGLIIGGLGLILWAGRSRWPLASIGMTVAGLTKLYPLALAPAAWRREGWPGMAASGAIAGVLTAWVWHPQAPAHVGDSLALFFGTFDEYAAPYRLLKAGLHPVLGAGAGEAASALLAAGFGIAVGITWLVDDGRTSGLRRVVAVAVVGFALTASTLHPWYWLPVLLIIPLLDSHSLLFLVAISSVGYLDYTNPGAGDLAIAIGWGGAAALYGQDRSRQRRLRQASRTVSTVAVDASSHVASE